MNERDELARDIFLADNNLLTKERALAEWEDAVRYYPGYTIYAYNIADELIAKGYTKTKGTK